MKIRPILFSTPMVQAIINLLKNQTRRIIKIPVDYTFKTISTTRRLWDNSKEPNPNPIKSEAVFIDTTGKEVRIKSKIQPGDILWVRETFVPIYINEEFEGSRVEFAYKASLDLAVEKYGKVKNGRGQRFIDSFKWKPSIFMPKDACRLFLECTNVRVERLQDISEKDAIAEGITEYAYGYWKNYISLFAGGRPKTNVDFISPCDSFESLWESINGKESWESNPWVWVYDFKVTKAPVNFLK